MLKLFLSHFRDMLGYTSCLIFTNIKKGKLKKKAQVYRAILFKLKATLKCIEFKCLITIKIGKEEMKNTATGIKSLRDLGFYSSLYLHSHFLGLFLYMLNDFIASTSVITSCGRTMFFPFF